MSDLDVVMENIRPFYGRVTVLPSNANQEQRRSGLIVPIQGDDGEDAPRGVVLHIDDTARLVHAETLALIRPGSVVFYLGGTKIGDVVVLSLDQIVAYLED